MITFWTNSRLGYENVENDRYFFRLQCVLHTYFFSIDMQLFWAAPILLFPLYFIGPFFLIFVFICFGLAIACATTVSYFYGFQAFIINNVVPFEKLTQYLRMIFFATHVRMGPWLIGVICGYIIYKLKDGNRRINYVSGSEIWKSSYTCYFYTYSSSYQHSCGLFPYRASLPSSTSSIHSIKSITSRKIL